MSTSIPQSNYNIGVPIEEKEPAGYRLDGRILLTAILCLIFVIVSVVFLHLYARHILRRRGHAPRNHRTTTTLLLRIGTTATSRHLPNSGLNPSAIAALPTFPYQRTTNILPSGGDDVAPTECAVCLSAVEDGELVRLLPNCRHVFHVGCIDMWLHSHSNCPVCRAGAEPPKVEAGEASAPPELVNGGGAASSEGALGLKEWGSSSRLRMLSRVWSGRRVQEDRVLEDDLERQ